MQSHLFCSILCFGRMHIPEVVGCRSWGVLRRQEEKLCCCCSLPVAAVSVHAVPWVRAPLAVMCLQQRARGAAFQLFPLHPSRKLVKAALEAEARRDAVVVLAAGRARSQPEQQGCTSGGISGASDSKEGSANACRSLRTGFCQLSILLFSFLILICMLQGWHVYV